MHSVKSNKTLLTLSTCAVKLEFHDADTDTDTDILATIFARMLARMSVSVSASWNANSRGLLI